MSTAPQQALRGLRASRLALTRTGRSIADGVGHRRALARLVDSALVRLWRQALEDVALDPERGVALAAVGSHGRRDAGPASDLDLLLLHDGQTQPARVAALARRLWYPIWDAGLDLDHSVRTVAQCRRVASADVVAAIGLLDLRMVAGDQSTVHRARSAVLADWRCAARRRLPALLASARARAARYGELADLSEPDLKEARGGLRDAVVIRAIVATGLAGRPRPDMDAAYAHLLDVRDVLAAATGRHATVLLHCRHREVAERLGHGDPEGLLAALAESGRTITSAFDETARQAAVPLRRSRVALPHHERLPGAGLRHSLDARTHATPLAGGGVQLSATGRE